MQQGMPNIYHLNSLEFPAGNLSGVEFFAKKAKLGTMDVVLTNPPFGSDIPVTDPNILRHYELAHRWERTLPRRDASMALCAMICRTYRKIWGGSNRARALGSVKRMRQADCARSSASSSPFVPYRRAYLLATQMMCWP